MKCPTCNYAMQPNDSVCPRCAGRQQEVLSPIPHPDGAYNPRPVNPNDAPSGWLWLTGFFIPPAGFIFWLCLRWNTPQRAKSAGLGALIGCVAGFVVTIGLLILAAPFQGL